MMVVRLLSLFIVTLMGSLLFPIPFAWTEDLKGSKDHPMVSRIPGSEIRQYEEQEFGQVTLPTGIATGSGKFAEQITVEGKVTRIAYLLPQGRSPFEVYRQFREALTSAGFEVLWTCEREKECGNWFSNNFNKLPGEKRIFIGEAIEEQEEYYLAARLPGSEGDVFVQVLTYPAVQKQNYARVRVVESRPMEEGLVKIDAEAMEKDLDRTGRVAIYGVTFDTDSAKIKPESNATLDEMAKLLKNNENLSVFIVGHTDATGTFDHNMDLSRRRAEAVAKALSERGISRGRLKAHGVGPLSPVDTNETDEGRSRNRRVEMVKELIGG